MKRRSPACLFTGARAFTLVELLMVVGVIAILGSVAYVAVNNARESTRVSKLESDVATINAAIQVYNVSGGSLPSTATPDQILAKLKTTASTATATSVPGLRSSFVDRRLTTEMQSSSEGGGSGERARWDGTNKRFVVATSGSAGVKNFLLDNSLAAADPGTENRSPTLKTTDEGWVWDYTDIAPTAGGGPATPGTADANPTNPPTAPNALQLSAPDFSQAGGSLPLVNFDLSLTLSNPNPPGTSQIYYSIGGGTTSLYKGQTLSVAPGISVTAYAATSDPDHWSNSDPATNAYQAVPLQLSVSLNVSQTNLTYAQAGGAMTTGTIQTPTPATVTLNSTSQIPSKYVTSSKFQVYYAFGANSPLTSGTAGPAFSNTYASPSVDVSIGNWGSASTLVVNAAARALDTTMFSNSSIVTSSIGITKTSLTAPTVDPTSGPKAADLPVSIATASGQTYPASARIYYTLDGTDPGDNNGEPVSGTLYTGQFSSGAGTNGVVVVKARVYGPASYGQWFTPSSLNTTTYATITTPEGALVGSANLNGTFVGSLVYALPSSGSMGNITFNSGAKILSGNLYLPGTPAIRLSNGTTWSTATDSAFSDHIQGWEYDSSGNKTVQTTPRVINETGSATPNNYTVSFNKDALLEGKVIRRHTSPAFPVIDPPPSPDSSGSTSLNSHPSAPLSASQYANITLNSTPVGDVRLNAGHYGNLIANNNTAFVLGDPDHPEITQVYSFQSLTLNSAADLKIVGKVIITVAGTINLNSGSVLGDINHPEYLQLQFSSGSMNANSGSAIYGQLVAPTQSVSFNSGSIFQGSVTAQSLTINSNSVIFNLPPVIQN
ncbi:MAG: prepilin-type N-terminal cleavage/methylation domain-containing protein [Chthoniobacterales bacterium]